MKTETLQQILPIGTVVTLKGGNKKVMIIGRAQQDVKTGNMFDYSSCYYPEGYLSGEDIFLFQQEDINRVFYVGLQEDEEFMFRSFLEEKLKEMGLLT